MSSNGKIITMKDDLEELKSGAKKEPEIKMPPVQRPAFNSVKTDIVKTPEKKPEQVYSPKSIKKEVSEPAAKQPSSAKPEKKEETVSVSKVAEIETKQNFKSDFQTKKNFDTGKKSIADEDLELKNLINRLKSTSNKNNLSQEDSDETEKKDEITTPARTNFMKKETVKKAELGEVKSVVERFAKKMKEEASKKIENREAIKTESIVQKRSPAEQGIAEQKTKKKAFWGNISQSLKKTSDSEKIEELETKDKESVKKDIENAKNKIEKYEKAGILAEKSFPEKSNSEELKGSELYHVSNISPENRLMHGKQERYSSISKRIELKERKNELEKLKHASVAEGEKKSLSKEEEYKKLKRNITEKYGIKTSSFPWLKTIVISVFVLVLFGAGIYFIPRLIKKPEPPKQIIIASGLELENFSGLEKIEINKENIKSIGLLESTAENKFNLDGNISGLRLLIKDKDNIVPLETALDGIRIIDIENGINNFPKEFLEKTTDSYNILVFKEAGDSQSTRMAIAIKIEDGSENEIRSIMKKWEEEKIEAKRMPNVLKRLFIDDGFVYDRAKSFNSFFDEKNNIDISYIHLPDKNTALNYFIHNNIIVFATSKDDTFKIVELLTKSE